ncbi:ty3-gypsy retrotransposon protein [Cucumis melo var. makuwa]|uniref:Ty3-gypsy retrotransposon protein n=1 Tax=Cucumis melo var. makuwa TaxID=1194695 RepID=A0A5A7UH83_CUCMM|nr:ty3-gypsy retrotransposon protein [Cucumis melo var. makuwa]TYK19176.1 ty3-gypsy retrotransposon protein [Cucumis melo var. makuwa]
MASKKAASKSSVVNDAYIGPIICSCSKGITQEQDQAHPDVMLVMMADITTEAAMAEMERKINLLMKIVEERDHKITALREHMRIHETVELSQTHVVKASDKVKNVCKKTNHNNNQLLLLLSQFNSYRI